MNAYPSQLSNSHEASTKSNNFMSDSQISYEINKRINQFMRKMKHIKNDTKIKHSSFISFTALPGYSKND
jgi:hypothetical protein